MRYDIYVTVWGEKWVDRYLEFSLPSQVHESNIPALSKDADIYYWIYTDAESAPRFDEAIKHFSTFGEMNLVLYEDVPLRSGSVSEAITRADPEKVKHNVQRVTSHHFLSRAEEHDDTAVILLDSDFVFSLGSWQNMHARRLEGIRSYMVMLLRLTYESATEAFRRDYQEIGDQIWESHNMIRLTDTALHHIVRSCFINADPFTPYPTQLKWQVGDHGFITHCFFPHPIMTIPDQGAVNYSSTMDYDFALRAVADDAATHLVPTSEEMVVAKLTPDIYLRDRPPGDPFSIDTMGRFILDNTNIRHRLYMEQPVRFVKDGAEEEWLAAEAETRKYAEAIYKVAELIMQGAKADDPRSLAYIKSFMGPIEQFMSPQLRSQVQDWLPAQSEK